jgi:metal-responsive CopG/Arc/MetJ family transcriptional regulator
MMEYTAVSLKKNLIQQVDEAVKTYPFVVSRAEFIRRAIEHFLKTYLEENNG